MQTRIVAVLLAALTLPACAVEDVDIGDASEEVNGGTFEPEHQFPWVVRVRTDCHGVLIDPSWVLTAAHCVDTTNAIYAEYSRTDPYDPSHVEHEKVYAIVQPTREVYKHPAYNPGSLVNDIALFRLQTPIVIDRYAQAVGLPTSPPAAGNSGAVASYINHAGTRPPGMMTVARAPILPDAECSALGNAFCAQDNDVLLCNGDSGSGFVRNVGASLTSNGRATVLGIASYTPSNNCMADDLGLPVMMTDVYAYRTWIAQTMKKSLTEIAGDARLRYNGQPSNGLLRLECEKYPYGFDSKTATGPMNAPGVEVRHFCGPGTRVRAVCSGMTDAVITGFKMTTTNRTTNQVTTTSLAYTSSSASYASSYDMAGILTREFTCTVGPVKTL